jgi:hypothetical protein
MTLLRIYRQIIYTRIRNKRPGRSETNDRQRNVRSGVQTSEKRESEVRGVEKRPTKVAKADFRSLGQ